jgi:hypothetical protein
MITTTEKFRTISPEALAALGAPKMVYVREVDAKALQAEGVDFENMPVPAGGKLFAVHAANGQRMALVNDREAAFFAARQHDLEPVSVH